MINLKNTMLPMKSVFINVKKCISELGRWLTAKHTIFNKDFLLKISQTLFVTRFETCAEKIPLVLGSSIFKKLLPNETGDCNQTYNSSKV